MKVYFNNSCKICKAEIDLYKKQKIEEIDWIDITDNELAVKETSKDSKQLLRRLHIKDGEKVSIEAATIAGDIRRVLQNIVHIEKLEKTTVQGVCPHVWVDELSITGEE